MSFGSDYTVLGEIGRGAMAVVQKATQRSLDRTVAIKRIQAPYSKEPEFVARFEREAKASANLRHVNILQIIDFGRDEQGDYFIVMEHIDGPSLESVIAQIGKLPVDVALSVAVQLLSGLDHAHSNGVIHRDIKPANIMLTTGGTAKITDFGIAQAASLPTLTVAGARLGTPLYMSPEQAAGRAIDHRSDLFSAGVLLYQMLAHALPFAGDSTSVLYRIVHEPPPPLRSVAPELSEALETVVSKALEKDVTRRFFDASEFAYALENVAFAAGLRIGNRVMKEFLHTRLGIAPADTSQVSKPSSGNANTSGASRRSRSSSGSWGVRPTAAILPLQGCFGCQVNLLDLHERFTDLVRTTDVQFSHLQDLKEIPEVELGLVEGCVANVENEEKLKVLRERCTKLVELGSCACYGGIPGLRNLFSPEEVLQRAYKDSETTVPGPFPDTSRVPALTPRVKAVHEVVKVDASIPGCPAPPELVLRALRAVLQGEQDAVPSHNLCHECPRRHCEMLTPQRQYIADDVVPLMSLPEIDPNLCFLEQGVLCMGLATREGCGARCMNHNVPCHGCMGPPRNARETGAKWIDALASLLPGGVLRFRHDLVGTAYRYTVPTSVLPERRRQR